MKITQTDIDGVFTLHYEDRRMTVRGSSFTMYDKAALEKAEISFVPAAQKLYFSQKQGTLYGIHFQKGPSAADRLFFCIHGRGIDYAVDLRRDSPTFLKWTSCETSAENGVQMFVPKGVGHIFVSLEDETENIMLSSSPIDSESRCCIRYDDPEIAVRYPDIPLTIAPHDLDAPLLSESALFL